MLPADKSDFPKFLYLDQNKWIDLARAHYGRAGSEKHVAALEVVRLAVDAGTLVVPMSGVHVMETMAPKDKSRRERLATFMVALSRNRCLLPHMSVRELEILQAVVVVALGVAPKTAIRTGILREGLAHALGAELTITGLPPVAEAELLQLLLAPETSVRLLVETGDDETRVGARVDDEAAVAEAERVRRRAVQELPGDLRHRVELAEMFTKGEPGRELRRVLALLGVPPSVFFSRLDARGSSAIVDFAHSIPTVDVFVTLGLERDKDLARPIHRNDLKDMAFLSMALPFANFVVTERFWGHVSKASGLAAKYKTIVETDVSVLPELLLSQGCLP